VNKTFNSISIPLNFNLRNPNTLKKNDDSGATVDNKIATLQFNMIQKKNLFLDLVALK